MAPKVATNVALASPLALFPTKPERKPGLSGPGKKVILITNLFKISIVQQKPIYRYGLTVDEIMDAGGDDKAGKEAKQPRKLPKEVRQDALRKAIESWVKNNNPKDFDKQTNYFNYVIDNNASAMFALFNMFQDTKDVKPAKGAKADKPAKSVLEINVELLLEKISENKLVKHKRNFSIKFHDAQLLNIEDLKTYCLGKGDRDITKYSEHIRALNVILFGKISTVPRILITQAKSGATTVFPFENNQQFAISPKVFCNKGCGLSIRPTEQGITLNISNSATPFYEPVNLVDFIRDRYRVSNFNQPLDGRIIDQLRRELKLKQVEARHINYGTQQRPHYRKYRIHDFSGSSMDKFTLVDKDTKTTSEVTVADYFNKEYKLKLKFPKMPCVVDNGRKLPLEVCHLIDKQKVSRKLEPKETAEVIKHMAVDPQRHFNDIYANANRMQDMSKPLTDFGLKLDKKPIEVEGRELPSISLTAGNNRDVRCNDGQFDSRRERFYRPAVVNKWKIAFLVDTFVARDLSANKNFLSEASQKFSHFYSKGGQDKGVRVGPSQGCDLIPPSPSSGTVDQMPEVNLKNMLKSYIDHLNTAKFDHGIIVLPDRCPDWVYGFLQFVESSKQAKRAPNEWYTRTSCIKYDNFMKKIVHDRFNGQMFISNLWLKYNTKFGGANFVLKKEPSHKFLDDGYIFISVDVCHPAPGDRLKQSVAAAVGMWDLSNTQMSYCTRLRAQSKARSTTDQSTVEEVNDIDVMFSDILEAYRAKKKRLPTQIVILRDGVSEGQFKMVLGFELRKVKAAVGSKYTLSKVKEPLITCFIVQKRHKVRFMLKQPKEGPRGPDYNIQPGTVVDTINRNPTDHSFYLAAHKAIKGTSRAPYIFIIYDDIGFGQDAAQAMIHALSYLSPRCTKGTSIPTPVNLADLAAEVGKNIAVAWENEPRGKMPDSERIKKINDYLADIGDANYKNTLYYI